eukprot:2049641-Prymnesium_polylepis.3
MQAGCTLAPPAPVDGCMRYFLARPDVFRTGYPPAAVGLYDRGTRHLPATTTSSTRTMPGGTGAAPGSVPGLNPRGGTSAIGHIH